MFRDWQSAEGHWLLRDRHHAIKCHHGLTVYAAGAGGARGLALQWVVVPRVDPRETFTQWGKARSALQESEPETRIGIPDCGSNPIQCENEFC